jgi:hypothetical protein
MKISNSIKNRLSDPELGSSMRKKMSEAKKGKPFPKRKI